MKSKLSYLYRQVEQNDFKITKGSAYIPLRIGVASE